MIVCLSVCLVLCVWWSCRYYDVFVGLLVCCFVVVGVGVVLLCCCVVVLLF